MTLRDCITWASNYVRMEKRVDGWAVVYPGNFKRQGEMNCEITGIDYNTARDCRKRVVADLALYFCGFSREHNMEVRMNFGKLPLRKLVSAGVHWKKRIYSSCPV